MQKQKNEIEYIDRKTGRVCRERIMGDAALKWAYRTMTGKMFSGLLFGTSIPSRILGWYFNTSFSRRNIAKIISDLDIDENEFAVPTYAFRSFNDFFTRKLKKEVRPFSSDKKTLLSPADGRILVYDDIDGNSIIRVKGIEDSLHNLFNRGMEEFNGGKIAVVRLSPADYHRYHFPCEGTVVEQVNIKGKYHSVNPFALESKKRIFCINKRSYTLIESEVFGLFAFMEIGAFGVAGIHQTFSETRVERMQEKGFFSFGGSTILLVFGKNAIHFEPDLVANSRKGFETLVKAGETIARAAGET